MLTRKRRCDIIYKVKIFKRRYREIGKIWIIEFERYGTAVSAYLVCLVELWQDFLFFQEGKTNGKTA